MTFQSVVDVKTTKYANSEQNKVSTPSTTDFFDLQFALKDWELNPMTSTEREPVLRPHVIESLERSLAEHGDVWAELAKH